MNKKCGDCNSNIDVEGDSDGDGAEENFGEDGKTETTAMTKMAAMMVATGVTMAEAAVVAVMKRRMTTTTMAA